MPVIVQALQLFELDSSNFIDKDELYLCAGDWFIADLCEISYYPFTVSITLYHDPIYMLEDDTWYRIGSLLYDRDEGAIQGA